MKLGHYMKIDPRTLFWAQFAATIWGSLVQIAVLEWAYGAIDNLCAADQKIITHVQTVKFSSMLRSFGVSLDPNVNSHMGRFIMGYFSFHHWCCDPCHQLVDLEKWPNSPVKYLHWPVFFSGTGYIPPATPYNYTSYCAVGLFFGWWIKKKWFHWWSKYNYSLSAGLDIGLAWCSLIIFLCLSLTNTDFPSWWGNDVINTTLDTQVVTNIRHILKEGEAFGPSSW